jgi:RimJ/RimL family protein N-acetyltransferase
LRPFTLDDFDDLYAYQSRPEVARYLHREARDRAQVRQALEDQCRETSLDAEGDWLTFAVQWREAGKVVGEVGTRSGHRSGHRNARPRVRQHRVAPDHEWRAR